MKTVYVTTTDENVEELDVPDDSDDNDIDEIVSDKYNDSGWLAWAYEPNK